MNNEQRIRFHIWVAARKGEPVLARVAFLDLYAELPDSPIILAQLADVEWETGNLNDAVGYFKKAVTLRPASETISLGLFHCLWELDRTDEAFDEMRRFVSEHDSDEYATLLREMRTRDGDEKEDNERAVPRDATH